MYSLLPAFFNDAYFNQGSIKVFNRAGSFTKGHIVSTETEAETIKCRKVIVPVSVKDLKDKGYGQFNADVSFQLYVDKPLKFSNGTNLDMGDIIEYDGFRYKLISSLNFKTHGFYNYYITKFEQVKLND